MMALLAALPSALAWLLGGVYHGWVPDSPNPGLGLETDISQPHPPESSDAHSAVGVAALSAVLAGGMALSMVPGPIIGILSRFFIDDLGLTRTDVGAVATFHAFAIMVTSVPFGSLSDRINGCRTQALMLLFVFLGLGTMALSWDLWSLLIFSGIAGFPAAGANSATNNIIVENVPAGSRGWITGIKQSGVQVGVLAAGLTMPVTAERLGWRWALVLAALAALVGIAFTFAVVPSGSGGTRCQASTGQESTSRLPTSVRWLAAYGVTMGIGVGAYAAFAPLYAQESLGMAVITAGLVIAVSGGSGALSRIVWGRIAERARHPSLPLVIIGVISLTASLATWLSPYTTPGLIWVGAVLVGMSTGSWMSVGMMGAIMLSGPSRTGRGTGAIVLGFGLGLTIGPLAFGWGVDTMGSYDLPWMALGLNFIAAIVMMLVWRTRTRSSADQPDGAVA